MKQLNQYINEALINKHIDVYDYCIDLGLPSGNLWVDRNIGASAPEETGLYFAWGETTEKQKYNEETYKFGDSEETIYKYNEIDKKELLMPEDDAAYVYSKGKYKMPSKQDYEELIDNCKYKKISDGYEFTSRKNNKKIFFPCTGLVNENIFVCHTLGYYWTASAHEKLSSFKFMFGNLYQPCVSDAVRIYGMPIRAIYKK